ncbi:hypothetical protein LTR53_015998 [Teratosphaeriaceae sp. CCFEE 6253]|nr:hypothetical protein LTR53_015998 [Teratosphaeriaceae sp. CCFEE 6253]
MTTRNFAIVRRHASPTPGTQGRFEVLQPDSPRYILLAAAWNKSVDAILSDRGIIAVHAYLAMELLAHGEAGIHRNHPFVIGMARLLMGKLSAQTPLLVDDGTFTTTQIVAEHPRGSWSGTHNDFNIRAQAIKLNSVWVNLGVQAMEIYRSNPTDLTSAIFQLNLLRLIHGYLHETGHLLQTYIGHGLRNTPPPMSVGRLSRGDGPEGGEVFEKMMIGGLLDFYNDSSQLGRHVGFPWISFDLDSSDGSNQQEHARRVSLYSIGLFLQPNWQGGSGPIITTSERTSTVLRLGLDRPRIPGASVVSTLRPSQAVINTVRAGLGPPQPGNDMDASTLRRFSSPPVHSEP